MLRLAAICTALMLAFVGCDGDDGDDVDTVPTTEAPTTTEANGTTTTEPDGDEALATCEADALTVRYPQDWSTNESGTDCRWFHPEPFDLPEATEATHVAVHLDGPRDALDFEQILEDARTGPHVDEIQSDEEATVDGQRARRLRYTTTDQGLYDAGTEVVTYLVDSPDGVLVMSTTTAADADFEESVDVLDTIAENLSLA